MCVQIVSLVRPRREGKMTMYSLTHAGEELVHASLAQLAKVVSRR
jgi:hypothetical protein